METETYQPARVILLGEDATPALRRATSLDALVTESSPPFFLWHTAEDAYVPPEHTYRLAASLAAHRVPHATHVFAHGPHSLGLARAPETRRSGRRWRPPGSSNKRKRRPDARDRALATYVDAETQVLSAVNGVDYAYRVTGASERRHS